VILRCVSLNGAGPVPGSRERLPFGTSLSGPTMSFCTLSTMQKHSEMCRVCPNRIIAQKDSKIQAILGLRVDVPNILCGDLRRKRADGLGATKAHDETSGHFLKD
jgi:hypothetical protein